MLHWNPFSFAVCNCDPSLLCTFFWSVFKLLKCSWYNSQYDSSREEHYHFSSPFSPGMQMTEYLRFAKESLMPYRSQYRCDVSKHKQALKCSPKCFSHSLMRWEMKSVGLWLQTGQQLPTLHFWLQLAKYSHSPSSLFWWLLLIAADR